MRNKYIDWTLRFKCGHPFWPWPSHLPWNFKVNYWIGYISGGMVRLQQNEKQSYWLNVRHRICPSIITLAMTLTSNFPSQMFNLLHPWKNSLIDAKQKKTYRLNARLQIRPSLLTSPVTNKFDRNVKRCLWTFLEVMAKQFKRVNHTADT